jgi:hypothetical protein
MVMSGSADYKCPLHFIHKTMLPKNDSIDVPAAIQNVIRQHMVP